MLTRLELNLTTDEEQQGWEENQVPPGVPFCLGEKNI
jgi:hypothetical protein